MKKMLLSLLILSSFSAMFAVEVDRTVIPNASYYIYEGAPDIIAGVIPCAHKYAHFYTATGDLLQTVEHNLCAMKAKLDPNAPKPQPVKYAVKYWPAFSLGVGKGTKGMPGEFIVFYDKHGNQIDSYRYDKEAQKVFLYEDGKIKLSAISELKNLDLSVACDATPYEDLRNDFKHQLYLRQKGLMSEERYKRFIEVYLQEAEKTLVVPSHLRGMYGYDDSFLPIMKEYFDALADYNVDHFLSLVSIRIQKGANPYRVKLYNVIKKLKVQWQFPVDPKVEMQQIDDLLTKANQHYYKKLKFIRKAQLFFNYPLDHMLKLTARK
jgi:hypothetical protein